MLVTRLGRHSRSSCRAAASAAIGQYLNETVVPAMALIDAGYDLSCSPRRVERKAAHRRGVRRGGALRGRRGSVRARQELLCRPSSMNRVRTLISVIEGGLDGYDGVFVPGGHAPAVDLMQDPDVGTILRHFHEAAKPTALLCHGPVAVAAAMPAAREFRSAMIAGRQGEGDRVCQGMDLCGLQDDGLFGQRGASGRGEAASRQTATSTCPKRCARRAERCRRTRPTLSRTWSPTGS